LLTTFEKLILPWTNIISTQNLYNRVMRKVGKTQHQNPEFGHTQGEIKKKPAKKSTLTFKGG
jgi:hypothetical protein